MKFDRNKTFPYPVLRPFSDDYQGIDIQALVDLAIESDSIQFDITFEVSSPEILDEVKKGNAKFVALVSCRETYFSKALSSADKKINASFSIKSLRGEVQVLPYIVAVKPIIGFTSSDLNAEFGKSPLSFQIGEVMAQDETQVFFVERDLFKPVTAVFDLVNDDDLVDGEWKISFDDDHIEIRVSKKMKQSIDDARNLDSMKVVLLNSIYFATVMVAIQRLQTETDLYGTKKWGEVFLKQIHNDGWDLNQEPYLLAQNLMKHPLTLLETSLFPEHS